MLDESSDKSFAKKRRNQMDDEGYIRKRFYFMLSYSYIQADKKKKNELKKAELLKFMKYIHTFTWELCSI